MLRPPVRPSTTHYRHITIVGLDDCTGLSGKGELILECVGKGMITPIEASSLMRAISSQARIIEVDELERRVAELEGRSESEPKN